MENKNSETGTENTPPRPMPITPGSEMSSPISQPDESLGLTQLDQSAEPLTAAAATPRFSLSRRPSWQRIVRFSVIGLALLSLLFVVVSRFNGTSRQTTPQNLGIAQRFGNQELSLAELFPEGTGTTGEVSVLRVNGTLKVTNGLALTPTLQPSATTAGQLYYDQNLNMLGYYNGSQFIMLPGAQNAVTSINGASGVLTLGPGLLQNAGQLSNSGVLAIGGQNGNLTLGNGLTIVNSQLRNTGVLNVTSGSSTLAVANDGSGNITITDTSTAGSGTVDSPNGTAGRIAKFTSAQTIADSLLNESGTTVTVGGDLNISGSLTLGTPLSVTNGGTGATSLTANGVLIGQGTGAITSVVAGGTGLCLMSTAGAPSWQACPGGGGSGVSSLNALTGALTVANATGSGSTITIDDASTSAKGIASFNSTNFTASSGAINTIQDINTTAAPTFGRLTVTSSQASNDIIVINNTNSGAIGSLLKVQLAGSDRFTVSPAGNATLTGTINGQTISSAANFTGTLATTGLASLNGGASVSGTLTANTITPSAALTVGATGQSFTLQGNSSSAITATSGGNTTSFTFQAPTANVTYRLLTAAAGTYDICTTAGNCSGVGGGVTTPGGTTNQLAKFTGSQTIDNSIISDNGSTVSIAGILAVNTITPTGALTVGSTSQTLVLQGSSTSLTATSGGFTNQLTFATPSGSSKTITLPNASGTVAVSASGPIQLDSSGNITCPQCVTSGGGGGGQGAVDSLNALTGALTIANATGSGSTITIDDASTSNKGIAQFNSTNFSASSGTINTIQDINTTAAPTFGRLTVTSSQASSDVFTINNTNASGTGSLLKVQLNGSDRFTVSPAGNVVASGTLASGAINGQTISSTANFTGTLGVAGLASLNGGASVTGTLATNTITPTAALTVGATGQSFTLQGNASSVITATDSGNTTSLAFQTPTASVTYRLPTAGAGTYDICTTAGNCVGLGGGVTGTGTSGKIAKFTGTSTIGDSLLSETGSTVTVAGNLNLTTGNQFQINGSQISSANLSNDSNLAKLNASQTFTGTQNTFQNSSDSTSAFRVQNTAGRNIFNVGTSDNTITLGNVTATSGQGIAGLLKFADGTNDNFGLTLNVSTLTTNRTIALPNESGTVCLQSSTSCGFALSSGSGNYIQNGTSTQTANFNIQSASAGSVAAVIQGAASQTADILQVKTGGGGYALGVDSSGRTFAGDNLFVGTTSLPGGTNGRLTVFVGNVNSLGQVIKLANTIGTDATNVDSLQIQDSAGVCAWRVSNISSGGASSSGSCDNSSTSGGSYQTQYRTGDILSSGSGTSGVIILRSGNNSTGGNTGAVTIKSGDATSGSGISGAVSIDTGSGLGGTSGITIGGTNASSITLGKTSSNVLTTINGRTLVKPVAGSTTAFQVQNASGVALLTADSTNSRTMLGNVTTTAGQELAGALFFADGTNDGFGLTLNTTTLSANRTVSFSDLGGKVALVQTAGSSTAQTGDLNVSGTLIAATGLQTPLVDTASAVALNVGTTNATAINLNKNTAITGNLTQSSGTFSITGNNNSSISTSTNALTITSASTATWSVSSGTLTLQAAGSSNSIAINGSSNTTSISTGSAGTLTLGSANTSTVNLGALTNNTRTVNVGIGTGGTQAQTVVVGSQGGASITTINSGTAGTAINSNGSIIAKSVTNSTTGFQVQNASSVNQLAVDTSNSRIILGTSGGDTTGTILVLGNKTNSGDPTGVNGAIYYNSSTHSFRCYINGGWYSCTGMNYVQTNQGNQSGNNPPASDTVANTTTATTFGDTYTIPANDCTPGRTYRITAGGMYGTSAASVGFNVEVLWGSTVIGEADKANASTPGSSSKTDENWYLEATVTCFTNFSSSTAAEVHGHMSMSQSSNGPAQMTGIGNKTKGQTVTTGSSQALGLRYTWGTANASNTITLRTFTVEVLGP